MQSVMEAVRASSRDKAWKKVIRTELPAPDPKTKTQDPESNIKDQDETTIPMQKDTVDGRHWRRRARRQQ